MQTRAMGPGAGWRWLMQGVNLGRHNPKAVFGGVALLIVAALVPTAVQLVVQVGLKMTDPGTMYALVAFSLLFSLLVVAPLIGGLLRVIHASEGGQPTRAAAIFEVFRSGNGAGRMVAISIALAVAATVVIGLIVALLAPGLGDWYVQVMALSAGAQGGASPAAIPTPPDGFGTVLVLLILFGLFLQGAYAIAFGQAALTDRSIGGALADGFAGALKNLLPLLVLLVLFTVFAVVLLLVVALLVMLLAAVGSLVHPMLGVALAAPVYLAFLMVLYVVVFGVMYHLWRDVAGDRTPPAERKDNGIVAA